MYEKKNVNGRILNIFTWQYQQKQVLKAGKCWDANYFSSAAE